MARVAQSNSKTQLKDFLKRIVPDGYLVGAWLQDGKIKQKPFTTHDQMAEFLLQKSFAKSDVYYATASYKQGWHEIDGRMRLRTGENVRALKSLWVDLDVGEKGYESQTAALKGLIHFIQKVSMPSPTLIASSGNGIHAYWTLDEPLEVHKWQPLATALKEAALELKFGIDPVCTADRARILRPIGTHNYKGDKRTAVQLLKELPHDLSVDELREPLRKWIQLDNLPARAEAVTNFDLGGGVGGEPAISYMQRIVKRCGVMNEVASNNGRDCDEPMWVAVLQLTRFTQDASDWVHRLSQGHPDYNFSDTEHKYKERLQNTAGPTLCSTFGQFRPAVCKKCPVFKSIKTPLTLGTDNYSMPNDIPFNWRYSEDNKSIERQVYEEDVDEDGNKVTRLAWVKAIPVNISGMRRTRSDHNEHSFSFYLHTGRSPQLIRLPCEVIANNLVLNSHLHSAGVQLKDNEFKQFKDLIVDWLQKIQSSGITYRSYEKFGWHQVADKLEFNLAGCLIDPDGEVLEGDHHPRHLNELVAPYVPKGDLDIWRKAADIVVQNGPAHALFLAAGFAAPLIHFTAMDGVLLSVVSRDSGVGKTTCMRVAQTIWGSVDGINALDDTPASVGKKMGMLNNLPAFWDELRGEHALEQFAQFVFKLTQGKERSRLRSDTSLRELATWKTMLIVASNSSVADVIGEKAGYTDAGLLRVFESPINRYGDDIDFGEAKETLNLVRNHYGLAGKEYARYLIMNVELVNKLLNRCEGLIGKRVGHVSSERFWLTTAATLLTGAILAGRAGVIKFDEQALLEHLCDMFRYNRDRLQRFVNINEPTNVLMDFLSSKLSDRLVVDCLPSGAGKHRAAILSDPPRNALTYQIAVQDKVISIPLRSLRDWSTYRKIPYQAVVEGLEEKYSVKKNVRVVGAGTRFATTNRVWCLDIDASHHDFEQLLRGFGGDE